MFTPNSDSLYVMPAHFGGIDENQENERPTGWYHDVTVLAVSYRAFLRSLRIFPIMR